MSNRLFSVVIPTYNRAASVCEAIDSVLAQTRKADEIIVVDDGSTDNTAQRLDKYRDDIILIQQPNQGVSAARNAGVAAASGEWIAFLDSDDLWYPNRLAVLDRDIGQSGAGVHVANLVLCGPGYEQELFALRGLLVPGSGGEGLADGVELSLAGIYLQATAVRREWMLAAGMFDSTLQICEDFDLLTRLALLGPWVVSSDIVACIRRIEEPASLALSHRFQNSLRYSSMRAKILTELANDGRLPPMKRHLVRRRLSGTLLALAMAQAAGADRWQSTATLVKSARLHPTLKGWAKILPPLLLGQRGYAAVLRKGRGFFREAG